MNVGAPRERKGKEIHVSLGVTRSEAPGQRVQDEQEREAVTGATLGVDPELASS